MKILFLALSTVLLVPACSVAQSSCVEKIPAPGDIAGFTVSGTNVVTQIAADGTVVQNNVSSPYSFSLSPSGPGDKATAAGITGQDETQAFTVCNPAVPFSLNTQRSYNDAEHTFTETASVAGGIMTETTVSHMSLAEGYILPDPCNFVTGCAYLTYQLDYTDVTTYNINTGAYTWNQVVSTAIYSFLAPDGSTWYVEANAPFTHSGSWPQNIQPEGPSYEDTVCKYLAQARAAARIPEGSNILIADNAIRLIDDQRRIDGTNTTLRDAEYALTNWVAGQIAIGNVCVGSGLNCLTAGVFLQYVKANPLSTAVYNARKWLLNGLGLGSWNRADADNPNSEPGGWDAAVDGYGVGLVNEPPEFICTFTQDDPPRNSSTALQPVPLPSNGNTSSNIFIANSDGSTFYIDPPMNAGFKYDAGVGSLIRAISVPAGGQNSFTLQFGNKQFALKPGQRFDFTTINPLGAATFKLYANNPLLQPANAFVLGVQPMVPGTMALSQEALPIMDASVTAQGSYIPAAQVGNATFAASIRGPAVPGGSFHYSYGDWVLASTMISHVSFIGPSTVVVRGNANVNGAGGFTFTATLAGKSIPRSIGIEILNADGSLYFSAAQQQLNSGYFYILNAR